MSRTRTVRFDVLLRQIEDGVLQVRDTQGAAQLVQAVCHDRDHVRSVARIHASERLTISIRDAVCFDLHSALNGFTAELLLYLTHDSVRQVAAGSMLCDLLSRILSPSLLWDAYRNAATGGRLDDTGYRAFASLALNLLLVLDPRSKTTSELQVKAIASNFIIPQMTHPDLSPETIRISQDLDRALRMSSLRSSLSNHPPGSQEYDRDEHPDFRELTAFPVGVSIAAGQRKRVLRPRNDVTVTQREDRIYCHLANQFRMLRTDLHIAVLDDLAGCIASQSVQWNGLRLIGISCGDASSSLRRPSLVVQYLENREGPGTTTDRVAYVEGGRHFSFGCIVVLKRVVAFAIMDHRGNQRFDGQERAFMHFLDQMSLRAAIETLQSTAPEVIRFVALKGRQYLAQAAVLKRLQRAACMPLAGHWLNFSPGLSDEQSPYALNDIAAQILARKSEDISDILGVDQPVLLNHAQTTAVVAGLKRIATQIDGPSGSGKLLVGAVLAKLLAHYHGDITILTVCSPHRGVDRFIEELQRIGVCSDQITRLDATTKASVFPLLPRSEESPRASDTAARLLSIYRANAAASAERAMQSCADLASDTPSALDMLESLYYDEQDWDFYDALSVTDKVASDTNEARDHATDVTYLFNRWSSGEDAGMFKSHLAAKHSKIWNMALERRQDLLQRWQLRIKSNRSGELSAKMQQYDDDRRKWIDLRYHSSVKVMKRMNIVVCTAASAAKYADQLKHVKPGVLLVNDADQVLESQLLACLFPGTEQVIMIGDLSRPRPKVADHVLTVASGNGFALDLSTFERLVLRDNSHISLI